MKYLYLFLLIVVSTTVQAQQIVNIPDANFLERLIGTGVDTNSDGWIQVTEAEAVTEELFLNCQYCTEEEKMTSLEGIEAFINVRNIDCSYNNLTWIDLSENSNLESFVCDYNNLTSLDLSGLTNLVSVGCGVNNLSTLDVSNLVNLEYLNCSGNPINNLNVDGCVSLRTFICRENNFNTLDVSTNIALDYFDCSLNNLTTLDVSQNFNLGSLRCYDMPNLTSLNLKNGDSGTYYIINNVPNLVEVCIDDITYLERQRIQYVIDTEGLTDCTLSSYCTLMPGGDYYTFQGDVTFDANNNGCDMSDSKIPNLKFNITDGNMSSSFVSDASGNFSMPVPAGAHIITPDLENPSYFNISPTNVSVDFPSDTSPFTQNFCITPIGVEKNISVSIIPLNGAVPGFRSKYRIVYKNTGNAPISFGQISLNYDRELMDQAGFYPYYDSYTSADETYHFNYTNLLPFESRSIELLMDINTPTETPAVNSGDILNFNVNYKIENEDVLPENLFSLNQVVVNSFDPNDITCLEGNAIKIEQIDGYLHYMIRFENSGTANAINVVVKDVIDASMLDVSTLRTVSSSHDMSTQIIDNRVEFIFENINLSFNDLTNDGYVVYKIKALNTLEVGDTIENQAEIFFDFNFPIITNNEVTNIENSLSIDDYSLDNVINVFPNPVTDMLNIKSKNAINKIALYTINGMLVKEITPVRHTNELQVDMTNVSSGMYFVKINSASGQKIIKVNKN